MGPRDFPRVCAALEGSDRARFARALSVLQAVYEGTPTRASARARAIATIGELLARAWRTRWEERSAGAAATLFELVEAMPVDALVQCWPEVARLLDAGDEHSVIAEDLRAFAHEARPLAHIADTAAAMDLAAIPRAGLQVGACACCFRTFRLVKGAVPAHAAATTAAGGLEPCPGERFPTLDRASDGLAWLLQVAEDNLQRTLRNLEARSRTGAADRTWNAGRDPQYQRLQREHAELIERTTALRSRLGAWRPRRGRTAR